MSIDQQFVEFVIKSLVTKPEAVVVERRIDEKGVLLELTVDPEDLGRVIGKRGATAQSVRTLLRALGTKNDARYNLKIVDNGIAGGTNSDQPKPANWGKDDDAKPESVSDEPDDTSSDTKPEEDSDAVTRARKELADLDDLDI